MVDLTPNKSNIRLFRSFWALFFLAGVFSLAFGGIFILIVPLSSLFWPGETYHALEMGILITSMFWGNSLAGLIFGRLIDKYNRIMILFIISLTRGGAMIMLSLAIVGKGILSWSYFYIFTTIIGFSAGGNYPSISSLSNDLVPSNYRSRFFGIRNIIRSILQLSGFVLTGFLVDIGLWRLFFLSVGIAIIVIGLLVFLTIPEPKRGIQRDELSEILKDETIQYDYKMDLKMLRKTILSKTNMVALIEGIFTSVFMGSLVILFLPYLQTEPHNYSPFVTSVFLALFGLTGGLFLKYFLSKWSDRLSEKNGVRRIYFIIISLIVGAVTFVILFYLPLPRLSIEDGSNILLFLSFPIIWIMGSIESLSSSISALYEFNQPPLLQEINLPEAQGQIVSLNRLLENIGWGAGPLITGIFIEFSGENYQITALLIGIFALPGIVLWILSLRWYKRDKENISVILEERALILKSKKTREVEQHE
ncbi:MAG: MFS transporter [Promethearchaeota archaeon]|jgi:MFS family permease